MHISLLNVMIATCECGFVMRYTMQIAPVLFSEFARLRITSLIDGESHP